MARTSTIERRAFARVLFALGAVAAGGHAAAQRVPEVNDVYAITPRPSRLGPDSEPAALATRLGELLSEFPALRYDFRMEVAEPARAGGTMTVAAAGGRWRAALDGRDDGGRTLIATIVFDGASYALTDLSGTRSVTAARPAELGTLGSLAEAAVLPAWPVAAERFTWLGTEEVGGEACHKLHFVDPVRGEHVYAWLSLRDALPRRLERVGRDGEGKLHVATALLTNPSLVGVVPPELR